MPHHAAVPQEPMTCQYQTGRVLGRGNFAVVKEAVHIKTGERFACKVISKKLMEGRENMVRTEISVLSKISSGHPNVVTLHDYFETTNNLYLCFDLCTGGQLVERICSRGKFHEPDAAILVKKICGAIKYIHDCGIVHRDLKPENLLFNTANDDAEVMIADFGLSRVVEEDKLHAIIEICGTPGYIAPEVYLRSGHGPAVDIWSLGIIVFYLLSGYIPINRATTKQELYDNSMGDYSFEPVKYWANVSEAAKDFITRCLIVDPEKRPGAKELLEHPWLVEPNKHFVPDPESDLGLPADLLPQVRSGSTLRESLKKQRKLSLASGAHSFVEAAFKQDAVAVTTVLETFIEEAETEDPLRSEIAYHHCRRPVTGSGSAITVPWPDNIIPKMNRQASSPSETETVAPTSPGNAPNPSRDASMGVGVASMSTSTGGDDVGLRGGAVGVGGGAVVAQSVGANTENAAETGGANTDDVGMATEDTNMSDSVLGADFLRDVDAGSRGTKRKAMDLDGAEYTQKHTQ